MGRLTGKVALMSGRIRANTLAPRLIDTLLFAKLPASSVTVVNQLQVVVSIGRDGTPVQAAAAASFLTRDESTSMTGAAIVAGSGQTEL